jgi:fused signal recognition particle receptor
MDSLVNSFTKIDEELLEELLDQLIMSDVGTATATRSCDKLRAEIKRTGETDPKNLVRMIRGVVAEMLAGDCSLKMGTKPSVILVIGVNGAGKTTTIGKLASKLKAEGKSVLLCAADTYRAAAIEQLGVWAERAGVELVRHAEGSDPAAVVYDAIHAGIARGRDVVICDTAGRLHNKKNLMDELAKIGRVITRELPEADIETLLVLDATTGQNALNQARLFKEAAGLTGIILTKLDGTAKGGVVIGIKEELGIPVKFIGVGEAVEDLRPFDAEDFAGALFPDREDV